MGRYGIPDLSRSIHMERWIRVHNGESVAEVAARDKVSEKTIQESLRAIELYKGRNTVDHANQSMASAVLAVANETKEALKGGLTATYEVEKERDGKKITIKEPDHSTRLKAVTEVREIVRSIQPKAPSNTNVNFGLAIGARGQPQEARGFVGMEDRLRELRTKMKAQPQLAARSIQTAELETPEGEFLAADDDEGDEAAAG